MYSMWILEYAHVPLQPVGSVLLGQHNKGYRELSFTYTLLRGNGMNILIDTGTNGNREITKKYHERDHVENWQPPEKILAKVGLTPDEIDYVLLTHAHYDHMDNLTAFKNAKFIIQERELMGWVKAMSIEKRFRGLNMALIEEDIYEALQLAVEGRLTMVNGEVKDILPGIDLYPAFDGHTFGSQFIIVNNENGAWVNIGDQAYVKENLTGIDNSGVYIPVGLATGSPFNIIQSYDDMIRLAGGDIERVIIGHETENWTKFKSKKCEDGLYMAEVELEAGQKSYID